MQAPVEFGQADLGVFAAADLGHERDVAPAGFQARHAVGGEAVGVVGFVVAAETFVGARERQRGLRRFAFAAEPSLLQARQRFLVAAEFEQRVGVAHQDGRVVGPMACRRTAPIALRRRPSGRARRRLARPSCGCRRSACLRARAWRCDSRARDRALVRPRLPTLRAVRPPINSGTSTAKK